MREKAASMSKQSETEDRVRLKPFMGIRPGVYLTVIYSIILLLGLFFLLVFPGLKNPGAVLALKTEPAGAAVRVDGTYMGTSADNIFVPKGPHTVEAVLPGFEASRMDAEIPGRVFASLLFPLRYPLNFTLETKDAAAAFALAAADYAEWSFGGEPTAAWQIPLSLSEGAYRTGSALDPAAAEILMSASRFTVTRAALRDIVRAKILLDSGGQAPSPAGLLGSVSDMLAFLSENESGAAWLSGLLPPESAAVVKSSDWRNNEAPAHTRITTEEGFPAVRRSELGGLTFLGIPAGTLYMGGPFPYSVQIKSFMISENPVPSSVFEAFLDENPSWREQNAVSSGISWFAADAFCKWFSKRVLPSTAAVEIRLPTEDEWEFAARSGIVNMENTSWEWCADFFAPLPFIKAAPNAVRAVGSPERSLKGRPFPPVPETRASLPPEFSPPFVTFRPVIAEPGEK
jgi:hypothetical protein